MRGATKAKISTTTLHTRSNCLFALIYSSYHLHCQGWRSIFFSPERAALWGDAPMNVVDILGQIQRWSVGLLYVGFSKHSPIIHGIKFLTILQTLCHHYACWPLWSIPIYTYAFLPQLALINSFPIFPKYRNIHHNLFLYAYLFVGAYGQDFLDFKSSGGTFGRWWSNQRMWMVKGLSGYLFGLVEYVIKLLGVSTFGYKVTSKVADNEQSKRYEKGIMEFGVASPLFLPITTAAIINLIAFIGIVQVLKKGELEELFFQTFSTGFVMVNCWPLYVAMILRSDKGRMPSHWHHFHLHWYLIKHHFLYFRNMMI